MEGNCLVIRGYCSDVLNRLSGLKEEDGRSLMQFRWLLFPLGHGLGLDTLGRAGHVDSHTDPCFFLAILQQGFHQLIIPVGCFNKDLGAFISHGYGFLFFYGFDPFGSINGQVSGKAELLAIHTGGH